METTFLKTLTEAQNAELAAMAAELKTLAAKLQSFRLTEGDNHGCVDEAAGLALAASHSRQAAASADRRPESKPDAPDRSTAGPANRQRRHDRSACYEMA